MSDFIKITSLFRELKKQPIKKFPALHRKVDAPEKPGVYVIYNPKGRVEHVGESGSIAGRLRGHLHSNSSYVNRSLKRAGGRLRKGYSFRYLTIAKSRHRMLLQAMAIGQFCPRHIGDRAPHSN